MNILLICAMVFSPIAIAATPLSPELAAVQGRLAAHAQLNVTGEQVYFMPENAPQARLFDTFSLKFDRPTKRLRASYKRYQGAAQRTDIEAWGTMDCLNMLRADHSPPGLIQAKSQECVHFDSLYSMLSEGTPTAAAPVTIMLGEIEDKLLPQDAQQPHRHIEIERKPPHTLITLTYDNIPNHVGRYWLNASGDEVDKIDVAGTGARLRIAYTHHRETFTASDFSYTPNAEVAALAAIAKDPKAGRPQLETLAKQGSKAAQLRLAMSEETAGLMYFGPPRGHPEISDQGWKTMDKLAKLGFSSSYMVQARWLGAGPVDSLPTQFKTWSTEQRKHRARELFWTAAKACDPQALQDLPRALSMGDEIFEPNPLKLVEFDPIRQHCEQTLTAPELQSAAARFADPWP